MSERMLRYLTVLGIVLMPYGRPLAAQDADRPVIGDPDVDTLAVKRVDTFTHTRFLHCS